MTDAELDIAALEALEKEASPTGWLWSTFGYQILTAGSWNTVCVFYDKGKMFPAQTEDGRGPASQESNARFIATLRNAAPALIAAYRERDALKTERDKTVSKKFEWFRAWVLEKTELAARDEQIARMREALEPLKKLADEVEHEFRGYNMPARTYRVTVAFGDCLDARAALTTRPE